MRRIVYLIILVVLFGLMVSSVDRRKRFTMLEEGGVVFSGTDALLQEDGTSYILQEDGSSKILLE